MKNRKPITRRKPSINKGAGGVHLWTGTVALAGLLSLAGAAQAYVTPVNFSGSFSDNFNEMGTTGTTAPAGWDALSLPGTHDNFAFSASGLVTTTHLPWDTSTSVASTTTGAAAVVAALVANTFSNGTGVRNASGYNFGSSVSPNVSTDRSLGSSPTGNAGTELQLGLKNTTGGDLNGFNLSYDIRRFTVATNSNNAPMSDPWLGEEELPGYSVYYSLDGTNWTNIAVFDPQNLVAGQVPLTGPLVPNTVGVTSIPTTAVSLSSPWTANSTLLLRWFDDNAEAPSPDQNIGLDNVVIAVPEPASMSVLGLSAVGLMIRRRRGGK